MPSRVIREGLLDSQRYWAVTVEARQLFVHLMLLADDFGLVSLAPVFIRRRCFDDAPSQQKIDRLIDQLIDVDLIRVYTAGDRRCAFIPRFCQRLRQMRAKNPAPPRELYSDDEHARNLFSSHAYLFEKMSASRRRIGDNPRPEVESEEKRKEVESKAPHAPALDAGKTVQQWAVELGIQKGVSEHEGAFQARVAEAVARHKAASTEGGP